MGADGGVVIKVSIDQKKAQQDLDKLNRKIQSLEDQLVSKKQGRLPLEENLNAVNAKLEEARKQLSMLQDEQRAISEAMLPGSAPDDFIAAYSNKDQVSAALKQQQREVDAIEKEWNSANSALKRYDEGIAGTERQLNRAKEDAGELQQQLAAAGTTSQAMADAMARMQKSVTRFATRLKRIVASALVFTVISQGLSSLREWMGKVIKTNSEAVSAISRLKGALLTMVQPIVNVVIPAFTAFLNILTNIIGAIANIISMIFGTTIGESAEAAENLYDEANAIESVGEAAEEAAGSLAGFDEINQITSSTASGYGSSSGSVLDEITASFDEFKTEEYKKKIDEITAYLSGALLALGAILCFSGANIPLGIALMAAGALGLVSLIALNWNSMDEALRTAISRVLLTLGTAALVIGAILCFSGANIPLGIGLMISGAAMLGTAVALNWNSMSDNVKTALAAILTILGAFTLVIGAIIAFSGANLPLGIGLMAAGAAMLGTAIGLNWSTIPDNVKAVVSAVTTVVGGALLAVGAVLCFSGANVPLGIGLIAAGAVALGTALGLNWDLITENVRTVVSTILEILGAALLVLGFVLAGAGVSVPLGIALIAAGAASLVTAATLDWNFVEDKTRSFVANVLGIASTAALALGLILIATGVGIPLGVALIAAGVVGLVTAAAINWDWLLDKIKGLWSDIKSWWNTNVSKYFSAEWWSDLGSNIMSGLLTGLKNMWSKITNWVSSGISWITSAFSGATKSVSSTFSTSTGGGRTSTYGAMTYGISLDSVPALARGAVVPPKREFLAVLGDNKQETEVVSPLSTIKQAMLEALQESGDLGNGTIEVKLMLDGRELARNQVKHINRLTQQAGKSVLLI